MTASERVGLALAGAEWLQASVERFGEAATVGVCRARISWNGT